MRKEIEKIWLYSIEELNVMMIEHFQGLKGQYVPFSVSRSSRFMLSYRIYIVLLFSTIEYTYKKPNECIFSFACDRVRFSCSLRIHLSDFNNLRQYLAILYNKSVRIWASICGRCVFFCRDPNNLSKKSINQHLNAIRFGHISI